MVLSDQRILAPGGYCILELGTRRDVLAVREFKFQIHALMAQPSFRWFIWENMVLMWHEQAAEPDFQSHGDTLRNEEAAHSQVSRFTATASALLGPRPTAKVEADPPLRPD